MFNFKTIATAALAATTILCVADAVQPQAAKAAPGEVHYKTCRFEKNDRIVVQMACRIDEGKTSARVTWADGAVDQFNLVGYHKGNAVMTDGAGGHWLAGGVNQGGHEGAWFAHEDGVRAIYIF